MRKTTFKGFVTTTAPITGTNNALVVVVSPEGRVVHSYVYDTTSSTFTQARKQAERFIIKQTRRR